MDINATVLQMVGQQCQQIVNDYENQINKAYLEADDDFSINLKVNFKPNGAGVKIKTEINFIADRVKDRIEGTVTDDKQIGLFDRDDVVQFVRPVSVGYSPGVWRRIRGRNGLK